MLDVASIEKVLPGHRYLIQEDYRICTEKDLKWMKFTIRGAEIFSTCGKRQYMAMIVDSKGFHVATGYNGAPSGMKECVDGGCPRLQENSPSGSSYSNCVSIHAEQNAFLHGDYSTYRDGGTIYVNGPPCFTCGKLIVNSRLDRLVYMPDINYLDFPKVLSFMEDNGVACFDAEKSIELKSMFEGFK